MLRSIFITAAVLATICATTPFASAATVASSWADEQQSSVRLIAARDGLGEAGATRAGIEFRLEPGWKVYWRSPGDAGFPPQVDFSASENATMGPLAWPAPMRFSVIGLETLGYENAVVLPFDITATDPARAAKVDAHIRYLTCKEICIPYEAKVSMTIPPGGGELTAGAHLINRFASQVPLPPDAARLGVEEAWTETSEKGLYVVARVTSTLPLKSPDIYVEGPVELAFGAPTTRLTDAGTGAVMHIPVSGFKGTPEEAAPSLQNTSLTMTLLDGRRASENTIRLGEPRSYAPGPLSVVPESGEISLTTILMFAFLGGLILNLMPCVLPVLSLKLLSLVKHGGGAPAAVRINFLASAAGIQFAFLVLAGSLVALKSAGMAIGWGIQFQQAWFLTVMAILVTLFACNMWGFFEFRLPAWMSSVGAGERRDGLVGAFAQGAFATLLATPCSAPFLGTAVGFALARGPADILAVFAVLGLGLATPYLAVAAVPRIATMMPKPGPWMAKLRLALGLALAATALWLLSVIAGVTGMGQALLTGIVLVGIALWLGPVLTRIPEIAKATPVILLLATIGTVSGAYIGDADAPLDPQTPGVGKIAWERFDQTTLERLVDDGRIVFVDVTADWCITCQVNKRLVLEQGRFLELLNGPDVVAMQADWTRPDAKISAYLASFDRYGIPFNAVYGPRARSGVALPELLSTEDVLAGFREAVPDNLAGHFD